MQEFFLAVGAQSEHILGAYISPRPLDCREGRATPPEEPQPNLNVDSAHGRICGVQTVRSNGDPQI